MKRSVQLIACLLLCTVPFLAACGHEHVWEPATCTEPATCSECGETEGEPLGHSWQEATCTTPKTCTVCGETEGEALGHDWIPATHDAPETCSRCGETRGEPLLFDIPQGLTADYQFGEFDTFNSYAYENGLGGTMIWLNCSYEDVSSMDLPEVKQGMQVYFAQATDENGHVWLIELDWNESESIDRYEGLAGHQLCVMGRYEGYSDVYQMPAIAVKMMFDRTTGDLITPTWTPDMGW